MMKEPYCTGDAATDERSENDEELILVLELKERVVEIVEAADKAEKSFQNRRPKGINHDDDRTNTAEKGK